MSRVSLAAAARPLTKTLPACRPAWLAALLVCVHSRRAEHRGALQKLFVELDEESSGKVFFGSELQKLLAAVELDAVPNVEKRKAGIVGGGAIAELSFEQLEHLWWECVNQKSHATQLMVLKSNDMELHPEDHHQLEQSTADALAAKAGGLTKGPKVSALIHTTKLLKERSVSTAISESEREKSRSTMELWRATPERIRHESLELLAHALQRVKTAKAAAENARALSSARVGAALQAKFRKRAEARQSDMWARKVQARWRMIKLREEFRQYRRCVIRIQAHWRGLRTRNTLQNTLAPTVWNSMSNNTVYIANVVGALEAPGKLKSRLTQALKRCDGLKAVQPRRKASKQPQSSGTAAAAAAAAPSVRTPLVLNCEMRIRERPLSSWGLVTFGHAGASVAHCPLSYSLPHTKLTSPRDRCQLRARS